MLGSALRVVSVGIGAGLIGGYWLTRGLESQLVDVQPTDPVAHSIAIATLFAAAAVAALVPAWRAARIDPLSALRMD
jgi:ABC-type antimicrobial peptide transport system permease subunit